MPDITLPPAANGLAHKGAVFTYTLTVKVLDVVVLQHAAEARAVIDGLDLDHWRRTRKGPGTDLALVLDPGTTPPGCSFEDSEVVEL